MQTLTMNAKTDVDGHLRLDLPVHLPSKDLLLTIAWQQADMNRSYDFSDLMGRLKWRGDPVAAQRSLRSEWT